MEKTNIIVNPPDWLEYNFFESNIDTRIIWKDEREISLNQQNATSFFYVASGCVEIEAVEIKTTLCAGWYGALTGMAILRGEGRALIATRAGYRGINHLGGPIEQRGRLRYIDGCSSTILVPPPKAGDPCLNLMHIPAHTNQTPHTHKTLRAGYIVSGGGEIRVGDHVKTLSPGVVFCFPGGVLHNFRTGEEPLRVISYHPDSEFGPSDEANPIVTGTRIQVATGKRAGAPSGLGQQNAA